MIDYKAEQRTVRSGRREKEREREREKERQTVPSVLFTYAVDGVTFYKTPFPRESAVPCMIRVIEVGFAKGSFALCKTCAILSFFYLESVESRVISVKEKIRDILPSGESGISAIKRRDLFQGHVN